MIDITINQLLGLILAIIGIYPSILLIRLYFNTRITDYLLFGLFFLDGIAVLILDPIAGITNNLIFFQLHHISIDTAYLILFIHACRMTWKRIPRTILFMGVGYYVLLFIMTLSWHVFTQPSYATVIFLYLPHSYSTYFPRGAGLTFNGVIIYSSGFRYIGEFYRIFSLSFLFYAYYFKTRRLAKDDTYDNKIKKARKIWLVIWTLFFLQALFLFPWIELLDPFIHGSVFETILNIFNLFIGIFLVVAGILLFYISFFLPEGLLLSNVQITRIIPLYGYIQEQTEKTHNSTIETLEDYLTVLKNIDEID